MHTYRPSPRSAALPPTTRQNGSASSSKAQPPPKRNTAGQRDHSDEEDEDERFPQPEGDADGGYSYDTASVPLVTRNQVEEEGEVVFDGDEEAAEIAGSSSSGVGEIVPYAHRDLKPGLVHFVVCCRAENDDLIAETL
jgi:serine/threonine kinase 16